MPYRIKLSDGYYKADDEPGVPVEAAETYQTKGEAEKDAQHVRETWDEETAVVEEVA